ncbi:MAG TPA: glycosyltransferase family 2 protein [Phycisphaerae bacterium]|nr:glycosyltransferase family 2 protein [Phycisphaerae bacterium]
MSEQRGEVTVLSVVIPVYNERDTWRELLARVEAVEMPRLGRQLILVDDGSTDGTRDQLAEFARAGGGGESLPGPGEVRCEVAFHERNRGKGAALRTGFAAAAGQVVVVQDADLEYDPNDHPGLIEPILRGQADIVYGSRFRDRAGRKGYWRNYLANAFLTRLSNLTTGLKLTDMETCYKMFRLDVLRQVSLEQDRFGFEPEITAKIARLDVRIGELPIRYDSRTHEEGKKIGWRDGLKAIWCILKYGRRLRRRAKMVPLT